MNFALAPLAISPSTTHAASGAPAASSASSSDPKHRKLVDAAQQFEGMLLQELLKPMREHSFGSGDTDSSNGDSDSSGFADTLSSFGSESLATAISRSGGLGIAKQVIQQVDRERSHHAPATGNGNGI
jgi:peptidoglycan hydrolase FlgJ